MSTEGHIVLLAVTIVLVYGALMLHEVWRTRE